MQKTTGNRTSNIHPTDRGSGLTGRCLQGTVPIVQPKNVAGVGFSSCLGPLLGISTRVPLCGFDIMELQHAVVSCCVLDTNS